MILDLLSNLLPKLGLSPKSVPTRTADMLKKSTSKKLGIWAEKLIYFRIFSGKCLLLTLYLPSDRAEP